MHWVVYIFGSGLAFFVGVGFVLIALGVSFGRWRGCPKVSTIFAILGLLLAILSGTPLPIWFYVLATLLATAWLIGTRFGPKVPSGWINVLRFCVALVWVGGAILEVPYQLPPAVAAVASRELYLFGDSLSAGLSERETDNWPQLLARSHDLELFN